MADSYVEVDDPPVLDDEVEGTETAIAQVHSVSTSRLSVVSSAFDRRWLLWPFRAIGTAIDCSLLLVLIAIAAAIPLLQFASLGYLLLAGARTADRQPLRSCLPGFRRAGKIGRFGLVAVLLYLPVLLMIDLAYSAELMQPGSASALVWRTAAVAVSIVWLVNVAWGAFRGGNWWHLLWPAPLRFVKEFWRPSIWRTAGDNLTDFLVSLQIPRLWWLGARATVTALLWLVIPVSLMIIGQRAQELPIAPLLGLVGAIGLSWLMFYLPFMQIEFARTGSLMCFIQLGTIRQRFAMAPVAWAFGLATVCILAIPLYILRIEATPADLLWLPSIVFVSLMLPGKLLLGWAIGRSESRQERQFAPRGQFLRWTSRILGISAVLVYIGALYLAQLVAGQGVLVMYFQHVFLAPNPLFSS